MLLKKILIWGKTVLTYFNVKINPQFCTFMGKKYQLFLVNEGKKIKNNCTEVTDLFISLLVGLYKAYRNETFTLPSKVI